MKIFRIALAILAAGAFYASVAADDSTVSTSDAAASPAPSRPTITFTNKSGEVISDAEVVRTNDGVSLVWEKDGGAAGGVVRLEDLPEPLREQFGYDADKTAAADKLAAEQHAQWEREVAAAELAAQAALKAKTNAVPRTNSPAVHQTPTATNQSPKKPAATPHHRRVLVTG